MSAALPAPLVVEKERLADEAAAWLHRALLEALARRERVSFALSGGSTPGPIHRRLAALPGLDWGRVDFYFVDERCVPPDHPDSNYRLVKETLLDLVGAGSTQAFRMEGERQDVEAAASDYAARLPPALDVVFLGMGPDGHTASLFPGHPLLFERVRRVAAVHDSPKPPPHRLTLTLPTLEAARVLFGVTMGENKADAVRRVWAGEALPAARVPRVQWMLDRAAAGQ